MTNPLKEITRLYDVLSDMRGASYDKEAAARLPWLSELKVLDIRGHFQNGEKWEAEWASELLAHPQDSHERWGDLVIAMTTGVVLAEPIAFDARDMKCPYCDARMKCSFDGRNIWIKGDACPIPEGIQFTEIELNVPSGRLVVENDLRQWFPVDEDPSINSIKGKHEWTLAHAAVGLVLGHVGNSSPSVFRVGEDQFVIGSHYGEDEDWDEEDGGEPTPVPPPWGGDELCGICTDLWAYSICDEDELKRRLVYHDGPEYESCEFTTIETRPGVYQFKHYQGVDRDGKSVRFADFQWVREPDPVKDYLAGEKARTTDALAYLIQTILKWPTLHLPGVKGGSYDDRVGWADLNPTQKMRALARAADGTMCVLGGGIEWHENGFPRGKVSAKAHQFADEYRDFLQLDPQKHGLPLFLGDVNPKSEPSYRFPNPREEEEEDQKSYISWYPISANYGGLCLGSGVYSDNKTGELFAAPPQIQLNPSFVALGLNICQSLIANPPYARRVHQVWPAKFATGGVRRIVSIALMAYEGFRKHYPDIVYDEKFDAWFNGEVTEPSASIPPLPREGYAEAVDVGPEHPPEDQWGPRPAAMDLGEMEKFVLFDASVLKDGHFSWHPLKGGCWAKPEHAQRYAICHLKGDAVESKEWGFCWETNARVSVPTRFVARVTGSTQTPSIGAILTVAFDYGTSQMFGEAPHSWGIRSSDLKACCFITEEEYQEELPKAIQFFDESEAEVAK